MEERNEGEFREMVPYGEGWEFLFEEPAEEEKPPFTEEELKGFQERQAYQERLAEWEKKQKEEEEIKELREEVGRKRGLERGIAKAELKTEEEELKAYERKYKRLYRKPGVLEMIKKAQIGKPPAVVPLGKAERRELYLGRAKKGLYIPSTPGDLSSRLAPMREVRGPVGAPLREVGRPRLETLREAGAPGAGLETPIAGAVIPSTRPAILGGLGPTYKRLRGITFPQGTSKIEQAAFSEIVMNDDRDTLRHVVSELSRLGVPKSEVVEAIRGLLRKGLVRRTREFGEGEPILEVVRR